MGYTIIGVPIAESGPHAYYRIGAPLEAINRNSEHLALVTFHASRTQFKDADYVLVQPYAAKDSPFQIAWFQKWGTKVFMDIDDNPFYMPLGDPSQNIFSEYGTVTSEGNAFLESLSFSDGVITPNPLLSEEYAIYNPNTRTVPSHVDIDKWDKVTAIKHDGQLWCGFAGAPSHFNDLGLLYLAVRAFLDASPDHYFVLVGIHQYYEAFPPQYQERIITVPWADWIVHYRRWVKALDIALAPLQDTKFNKYKSDIKLLEYGLGRCSVVASPCLYKDVFDYESCVYASTVQEWADAVEYLAKNESVRRTLANSLRTYVEVERIYDKHWRDWIATFEEDWSVGSFFQSERQIKDLLRQSQALLESSGYIHSGQRQSNGAENLVTPAASSRRDRFGPAKRNQRWLDAGKESRSPATSSV